jgi:hypothetical protein
MRKILFSMLAFALLAGSATAAPIISNIHATPQIAVQNQFVVVSAKVNGTADVNYTEIVFPALGTSYRMTKGTGFEYQIYKNNATYFGIGNYQYYIHAVDINGVHTNSSRYDFQILYKGASETDDIITLFVPEEMTIFNHTKLMMEVKDPHTGLPAIGKKNDISCYVMEPNGTLRINGTHPYELTAGIYALNFSVTQVIGTYFAWVEMPYDGMVFEDADSFNVVWDLYDNMTMLTLRMGDVISIVQWEIQNSTRETISHISARDTAISDIKGDTEAFGFFGAASDIVLGTVFQWIFTGLLLLIIFVIATWIYGRGKAIKIARRVANIPGLILERAANE